MKYRTTSPSRYYERQTHAKDDVQLEYPATPDYEAFAAILGAAVCGFALGMIVVATWAGVL
jgi:hypothetical protein